jgi:radical SAM protein with 4Fe4S-binding SPASM domain
MDKWGRFFLLLKQGSFVLIFYKLIKKLGMRNIVPPLPSYLMIEPANACNLRCPACPTGSGKMNRPARLMSLSEFKGIIDQVKGNVSEIYLWNYGEPFLNPDLLSMIAYATQVGIKVIISTNGAFFKSEEFCFKLVQSGLDHMVICIDGNDQETISKYRVGLDFNKVIEGFRFIKAVKKRLNTNTPKVEFQLILMKTNEHLRNSIKQLAIDLGADIYCEKALNLYSKDSDFYKLAEGLLPNDLSLSCYYRKEDGTLELKGSIPNKCSFIQFMAVINSDGTVVPCCYDLYSDYIMGNVFHTSLKYIWKNNKYRDFRNQIKMDRKSIPMCIACPVDRVSISYYTELS